MAELTVDLTYGNALYSAAADLGMKESILREGEQLVGILKKEPVFDAFLKDPVVSAAEKKATLKNIFEGKISKELLNFMYILVDKGRAGAVCRYYQRIQEACRQRRRCSIRNHSFRHAFEGRTDKKV